MNDEDRERLRIQRLREQQLRARDPGKGVKVKWKGENAVKKKPLWDEIYGVLPGRAKGAILGGLLGMIVAVAANIVLAYPWGMVCGSAFFIVAIIVGIIVGISTEQGGYVD